MKNILILFTSSGYGHKKIAEHIGSALQSEYTVDLIDLFDVEQGRLVSEGTNLYLWILKHVPWLWNFFYTNKIFIASTLWARRVVAGFKSKQVEKILCEKKYDIVITTQVNASAIISYLKLKKKFSGKFVIAFSDFHFHPYWCFDNADLYLVNVLEQKDKMITLNISENKIAVCGITVPSVPSETENRNSIRERFHLSTEDKVILILGGGRGLGVDEVLVKKIINLGTCVFVVCGQNEILKNKLDRAFQKESAVRVLGFINYISDLYKIADAVVGKPGALTVAETMSYNVPMFLVNPIAGQETMNQEYLLKHNLVWGGTQEELPNALRNEIQHRIVRNRLVNNPQREAVIGNGNIIKQRISQL